MRRRRGRKVCNRNFTTDINTAASLHFLCAIENALVMEYCVEPGEISRSLAVEPVRIVDGHAHLPPGPGLGVEPRADIIEKIPGAVIPESQRSRATAIALQVASTSLARSPEPRTRCRRRRRAMQQTDCDFWLEAMR